MAPKHRTRPTPGTVLLKAVDQSALTATALLTYPEIDYAGDWVQPDGGEWEPELYVRTGVPVDRAHGAKIGFGTVEMVTKSIDGKDWLVPLGTTHFRRGDRLAEQTFRLVADDIMTGVSLEFEPLVSKSFGRPSPLPQERGRDAMKYDKWHAYGWAHDVQPICRNARTLLPDVEAKHQVGIEKAIRIAETGRYGSEYQHPLIIKALSTLLPASTRTTVRVEKAVDYGSDQVLSGSDAAPSGSDTYPTAAAAFDLAQSLLDACDMAEQSIANGEHVKGRDKLAKLIDDIRSYVDDCNAVGEMVESDLDGKDESEADDAPEADAPVEKALIRQGILITKSGYVPKRFKLSDFKPALSLEPLESLELKAAESQLEVAQRRLRRASREARPLLDAIDANN